MSTNDHHGHPPDKMFTVLKDLGRTLCPRLGRLVTGNANIQTPHYLAVTSRGVVPHLSQDTFARDTNISGVYIALEDFIEKYPYSTPPLYQITPPDGQSRLRRFVALPSQTLLVLGARRTPPVAAPAANSNTNSSIAVCTSVGFRTLGAYDYIEAAETLHPDIVVAIGDIPYGRALVPKRVEKAVDRQIDWMQNHIAARNEAESGTVRSSLFASLLPLECAKQQYYIDWLVDNVENVDGVAVYDLETLQELPEKLQGLPRLGFNTPSTPHEILRHVGLGIDLITIPFIGAATDAGIALDFTFGPQNPSSEKDVDLHTPLPLGVDMWSTDHATDLSPLSENCTCYACTNHHRAFLQHLLAAKEMLGWVLLQIHNHHTIDVFFAAIRKSLADGTFDTETERFAKRYEALLPEKTGKGPRVRGYQFKSEGPGEPKKNESNFTSYNNKTAQTLEATPPSQQMAAIELEERGFAKQQ